MIGSASLLDDGLAILLDDVGGGSLLDDVFITLLDDGGWPVC
jgi:hypothetical protein